MPALLKTRLPTATTSDAPTYRKMFRMPDASPASAGGTCWSPAADGVENVMPTPSPAISVGPKSPRKVVFTSVK